MRISKHKLYMAVLDVLIFNASFMLSYYFNFSSGLRKVPEAFPINYLPSTIIISFLIPILFQPLNLYKYQIITDRARQATAVLKGYFQALLIFIAVTFLLKAAYIVQSRVTIGLAILIGFILTAVIRCFLVHWVYFTLVRKDKVGKRALIIGTGEEARQLQQGLDSSNESYFRIVGFCDSDPSRVGQKVGDYLILGTVDQIEEMIHRYQVEEILIAIPNQGHVPILQIIDKCKEAGSIIHVISDLYKVVTDKMESEVFGNLRTFRITTPSYGLIRESIKRAIDLIASILLLILLLPLFAILYVLIKLDSPGPVFFRTPVIGKDCNSFILFKFRTMFHNNDPSLHEDHMKKIVTQDAPTHKINNDPRITRVGRFLRKFSLDELPQLINVLKGEMSLVGPRQLLPYEFNLLQDWQKARFQVRPGITGPWQVCGRNEVKFNDMIAMDLHYVYNQSFWYDLEILFKTIPVVLWGRGGA